LLSVDKETYEQLGLEGKKSSFPPKGRRFNITIDMMAATFREGKPFYQRCMWCFQERMHSTELLVSFFVDGKSTDLAPLNVFPCKKFPITFRSGVIPDVADARSGIKKWENVASKTLSEEENQEALHLLDYVGFLSCHSLTSLRNQQTGLSTYSNPLIESTSSYFDVKSLECSGFLAPHIVLCCLEFARGKLARKEVEWVALHVNGFQDSPVSWGMREHGFFFGGENDYTFIMLPKEEQYILFIALGTHDSF